MYLNVKIFGWIDLLSRLSDSIRKPNEDIIIGYTKLEENCSEILTKNFNSNSVTFNIVPQQRNKC